MKVNAIILSFGLLTANAGAVGAQTAADLTTQSTTMNKMESTAGGSNVVGKISGGFSSFLGSDASAVVTGLRSGTPITLKTTSTTPSTMSGATPTTTTTTVITPPTGHMGYGNAYISLALAKQQLGALGITQPTPSQLQAALTGGEIIQTTGAGTTATMTTTKLDGVLTLRSQKMGWGQIAQKLGYKLGPVISGMKSANQDLASQSTSTGAATAAKGAHSNSRGIVSAGAQSQGNSGHGTANGRASGSGIVTASGRSGNAYDHGRSSAIATGSGQSAGSAGGVVSAGGGSNGGGNGQAKGHSK